MRVSRMTMVALAAFAAGCAGSTGGACAGCAGESIPGGFSGEKKPNAAVVRISAEGFEYLNSNWMQLFAPLLPGASESSGSLVYPIELPCMAAPVAYDIPYLGTIGTTFYVCDNGAAGVGSAGFMDGKCDGSDRPCPILVTIDRVRAVPKAPDSLNLELDVRIDATKDPVTGQRGAIFLDTYGDNICPGLPSAKPLGCFASYHSDPEGGLPDPERLATTLKFALEQNWSGQLTFDLTAPDPEEPAQLIGGLEEVDPEDIAVTGCDDDVPCGQGEIDWCDMPCNAADVGFVKDLLINKVVKPQLQAVIQSVVDGLRCRACNPSDPLVAACPGEGVDSYCRCPEGGSACEDAERVCVSSAARGGACVPPLLGTEQYVDVGGLLSRFGADPAAKIEAFAAAGGGVLEVGPGLQVGMLGGARSKALASCVPDRAPPVATSPASPDLAGEGPAAHHVGLAISEYFLNHALWEAHRSGAACLNIGTAQAAPLTTGLFKTFLPSLGVVAGSESADAPMMIALRPLEAPVVHVGEGSFDPVTHKPVKPLVTLEMKDVRIDFYALVEGRFARLFTLGADVDLPLSLIVEGSTVLPALGDLRSMFTIRGDVPANSELLAEDPQVLAQLIPMVLGMAEPALATLLQPMALPEVMGLRLQVDAMKGVGRVGSSEDFNYLGAFATLAVAGEQESWGPRTIARLVERRVPSKKEMRLEQGRALPWPSARIEVAAEDLPGQARPMEFAWRVDAGLWSTWFEGPALEVSHPVLMLPGKHRIEVRARVAGRTALVDPTPEALELLVDWDEPVISMSIDRLANRVAISARDAVSVPEALRYSYRVGAGEPSAFGPLREVDLAAVEVSGGLEVRVQDEAGNVAGARWGVEAFAERGEGSSASEAGQGTLTSGCSSAGAGLAGLAGLLALAPFALRRRRS